MSIGDKFGHWTVIGPPETRRGKSVFDFCRCVCGKEKFVKRDSLTHGTSRSCGCMHLRARHGMYLTKTYRTWTGAKRRCRDANHRNYASYGGRGITFHPGWDVFENFLADMGEASPGMTLGRIDNNKGYEPGNCRWETPTQQARNKRNTTWIEIDGVTKCIADWADEVGILRVTLRKRMEAGWTHKEAVYGKEKA